MKALIQRVRCAGVSVGGNEVAAIERGLLVFVGVEQDDDIRRARRLAERVLSYRVFPDANDRMNLNVVEANGGVLAVSQFTLVADTARGTRPGFSTAATPEQARQLYEQFVTFLREVEGMEVPTGVFAADMQVSLVNDGPVTFLLET